MRVRRALAWSLAGLVFLALAGIGAWQWASRSESALRWAVELLARRLPGSLTLEGLHGAVLAPVRIARLVYVQGNVQIEARVLTLEWWPLLLRDERLEIQRLRIAELEIRVEPHEEAGPAMLPEHLRLPLEARVQQLEIGSLKLHSGARVVSLNDIALAYAGGTQQHSVELKHLHSEWGNASGTVRIAASSPFALKGKLALSTRHVPDWPASATMELSGSLPDLVAQARIRIREVDLQAQARLAPFDATPLRHFTAHGEKIPLAQFVAAAPPAELDVTIEGAQVDTAALGGKVEVTNRTPGRIERGLLPVHALSADFDARERRVQLSALELDLGAAGQMAGSATVQPDTVELALQTGALNLRELHGQLLATRLAGALSATAHAQRQTLLARFREQGVAVEIDAGHASGVVTVRQLLARSGPALLDASGTLGLSAAYPFTARGRLMRFDPSRFGDFPAASLNATLEASGQLQPAWSARVRYAIDESRARGAPLSGRGTLVLSPERVHDADASLLWGGNRVELRGAFGAASDRLQLNVDAPRLGAIGLPLRGGLKVSGAVGGSAWRPSADLALDGRKLQVQGILMEQLRGHVRMQAGEGGSLDVALQADAVSGTPYPFAQASLQVRGLLSRHLIELAARGDEVAFAAQLEGAWQPAAQRWSGELQRLRNDGRYPFALLAPTALVLGRDEIELGVARVEFAGGRLELGATRYAAGRLVSEGSFTGVPLARVLALAQRQSVLESSLVLGGRWSVRAADRVDGDVQVYREQGDITLLGERQLALQLSALNLNLEARDSRLSGSARLAGERLGSASASFTTRMTRREGRWGIAGGAPLQLTAQADVQSVRPLAALLNRQALVDGRLRLRAQADGTLADPRLRGTVDAQALRLEHAGYGVFLRDGTLAAKFEQRALELTAFTIQGAQGTFSATGRLSARERQLRAELDWHAERLSAVTQPDLKLVLSGQGKVDADGERIRLRGKLKAEQGRAQLHEHGSVRLGKDVVVVGKPEEAVSAKGPMREDIDLLVDLGEDFHVNGLGIDARLLGQVRVTTTTEGTLRGDGQIAVAQGMYEAYGQRLAIDKGVLYFAGPLDNPGIEIRALRKNQQVEAGVEVTGTARDPHARLVSSPEVPDAEKLSWLLYGRSVPQAGSSEQAQQAYALALAAGVNALPLHNKLAKAVGLDEIRFAPGTSDSGTQAAGVISLGKQISDRIYIIYEQGITSATNAIKINYQLAKNWSVRTESGTTDALDVFYTISFD